MKQHPKPESGLYSAFYHLLVYTLHLVHVPLSMTQIMLLLLFYHPTDIFQHQSYLVFQICVCLCNHAELAILPEVGERRERRRGHNNIQCTYEV